MPQYIGRFAPSPSGDLHFGSLVCAVGSYLEARYQQGKWLLRIEDIDTPRCQKGAAERIMRRLETFGFEWHGTVVWQSQRHALYADALLTLQNKGLLYPCTCSRQSIKLYQQKHGLNSSVYPHICREGLASKQMAHSTRLRVLSDEMGFNDRIQGYFQQNLTQTIGDFVLKRADGLLTYQLAVVVDDAEQGVTDIMRGSDLLAVTPQQIYLQHCLNLPTPTYAHLPIVVDAQGQKLSKRHGAVDMTQGIREQTLWQAFDFLGLLPPDDLFKADLNSLWQWAFTAWALAKVPRCLALPYDTDLSK